MVVVLKIGEKCRYWRRKAQKEKTLVKNDPDMNDSLESLSQRIDHLLFVSGEKILTDELCSMNWKHLGQGTSEVERLEREVAKSRQESLEWEHKLQEVQNRGRMLF